MTKILAICVTIAALSAAPQPPAVDQILARLDKLEQENDSLRRQLQELRSQVSAMARTPGGEQVAAAPPGADQPTVGERLEIAERRIDEQAQTKVEASQRFPVKLSGMLIANLYHNNRLAAGQDTATTASRAPGRGTSALTFRQSVVGLEFDGPQTFLGGHVKGSAFVDFYEGNTENAQYPPVRLRTASVEIAWKARSVMVGMEKPLIALRDPTSFSFVGVSPLTSAGNLWRWQPQIRFEQRLQLREGTSLKAQGAFYQTSEDVSTNDPRLVVERRRPGIEGRFELEQRLGEGRKVQVAPSFHVSESHVSGVSLPSRLMSVDWFANPFRKLEVSGVFFSGENIQHFGVLRQGISLLPDGRIVGVNSKGGWAQVSVPFASRISLNLFSGIHDDRNRDLTAAGIAANRVGGTNLMYRLGPNLLLSIEAMQIRTQYLNSGQRKNNRYDLSVVYLF